MVVIGAGINGAGIARDAVTRGLRVLVCDKGDVAGATSWASTKLIHGGLRYLEHNAFGLVREALAERELMLRIAPHLVREQRFIIPHSAALRPAWMISLGLLLYDRLAGRSSLEPSATLRLTGSAYGAPLKPEFVRGFAYSDLAVDDARLTLLTLRAAADAGATVLPYTPFVSALRRSGAWEVELGGAAEERRRVGAKALVNAAGPWVAAVRGRIAASRDRHGVRLVQGSHVVVPRLFAGDHAYLFQNDDRRVVFAIPFESDFTMIGTTEVVLPGPDAPVVCTERESDYLCAAVSRYLRCSVRPADVIWSFAGVRALYDDGRVDPSAVTREYRLVVDGVNGEAPLVSVFGGKLTTYRRLAERVMDKLRPWFRELPASRTADLPLPGASTGTTANHAAALRHRFPGLPHEWLNAVAARHGELAATVVGGARTAADLGRDFGGLLYEREVAHFIGREWALEPDDILWRRTKCGLRMATAQRDAFAREFAAVRECVLRAQQ